MTTSFIAGNNPSPRSPRNRQVSPRRGTPSHITPHHIAAGQRSTARSSPAQTLPFQPRSLQVSRGRNRRFYYLTLISEASLKILINGLLLSAFAVALGRLLPQMWRNNQQRVAIETELQITQTRVNGLEQHFNQTFAPQTSLSIIEDQSYQIDPQKRRIVFLDKPTEKPPQE